ncbi:MAG: hypothetical protein KIT48_03540 [Pseudolabrys sp.]|nr:hypothetical protein [Pseudolabrys sp.]
MAVGAALLVGVLAALVVFGPKFQPTHREPTAEEVAANIHRENLRARSAYRQGSILIVDPDSCTDYAFDNWTGNIQYKSDVDCDARLAAMQKSQTQNAAERVRSVVEGFRR